MPRSPNIAGSGRSVTRAVIDTNLLVSATLQGAGIPGQILDAVWRREVVPVFSRPMLEEYRDVLARPKFGFDPARVHRLVEDLVALGQLVEVSDTPIDGLPDPKDWPVIAAALAGRCPVVSGNIRHFPPETGVTVLTPRGFFDLFIREPEARG